MNLLSKIDITEIEHTIGSHQGTEKSRIHRKGIWTVHGPSGLRTIINLPHTPQVLLATVTTVLVICSVLDTVCEFASTHINFFNLLLRNVSHFIRPFVSYFLDRQEDRAGTPTIDERNLDAGNSMHHAPGGHHPPPLHYADMSVPPPVVPYAHQPYGKLLLSFINQYSVTRFG